MISKKVNALTIHPVGKPWSSIKIEEYKTSKKTSPHQHLPLILAGDAVNKTKVVSHRVLPEKMPFTINTANTQKRSAFYKPFLIVDDHIIPIEDKTAVNAKDSDTIISFSERSSYYKPNNTDYLKKSSDRDEAKPIKEYP